MLISGCWCFWQRGSCELQVGVRTNWWGFWPKYGLRPAQTCAVLPRQFGIRRLLPCLKQCRSQSLCGICRYCIYTQQMCLVFPHASLTYQWHEIKPSTYNWCPSQLPVKMIHFSDRWFICGFASLTIFYAVGSVSTRQLKKTEPYLTGYIFFADFHTMFH